MVKKAKTAAAKPLDLLPKRLPISDVIKLYNIVSIRNFGAPYDKLPPNLQNVVRNVASRVVIGG